MKKVSIVIPVYGVEDYIENCMKSLLEQTSKDFLVYIVDDGSKDDSIKIAKNIVNGDQRFIFLTKENGGLSDARNYGLKYVDTEYVMFIDSDDFVEKDFIEKALKAVKDDTDIVVFGYNAYYSDGTKEKIKINIDSGVYNISEHKEILAYCPNAAWNKLYRTSLFKNNNLEYPKGLWYEDLGTTPKLLLETKSIVFIDDCLYNYLSDRPNNISTTVSSKVLHIIDIVLSIIDYYKKSQSFDLYYNELHYLAMRNFIKALRLVSKSDDKKLVIDLRNKIFRIKKDYFNKSCKYKICIEKGDWVYCNKFTFTLYCILKGGL